MNALSSLFTSTIGKKVVMATTGLIMVFWLLVHMAGHFIMFSGQGAYNHYAHFIQSGFGVEPALLWLMRAGMLGAVVAHIASAISLTRRNVEARPIPYAAGRVNQVTGYPAQLMRIGGIFLLLYMLFHLAHLTVGLFGETVLMAVPFDRKDAYANMMYGLANPGVAVLYLLALAALGAHLRHGVWSAFHTLGLSDPRWDFVKTGLGNALPVLIAGGFAVVVIAVVAGVLPPPDPGWRPPKHWTH